MTREDADRVKPLGLDVFPVRWRRKGLRGLVSRYLLASRLRACTGPVLLTKNAVPRHYTRLLVPVRLTTASTDAASIAARLAQGRELAFLHAYLVPGTETYDGKRSVQAASDCRAIARDAARMQLENFVGLLAPDCSKLSCIVQYGRAKDVIAAYADRMNADLVILDMPRSGSSLSLLNECIASDLLAHTSADVLLVPPGSARVFSPQALRTAFAVGAHPPKGDAGQAQRLRTVGDVVPVSL